MTYLKILNQSEKMKNSNLMNPAKKTTISRILAFSAPSLPLAALGLPAAVHLPNYYSSQIGIPIATVGAIFMLARIFDVFVDFGLGIYMDKTKTKFGRFTPWLLAGAPIMGILAYFLFNAKIGASVYYLFFSLVGTYIGFSMCMLAQLGVGSSLSNDYDERSRIFGFWQIGNIVGMLFVLALPVILGAFGFHGAIGVNAMGIFIAITIPLGAIISWKFAHENVASEPAGHQGIKEILALFKLKSFRNLLASDFIISFALGVTGALFIFYLKDLKGYKTQSDIMFFLYFLIGLVCTPIWTKLARKMGKHIAFAIACVVLIISQALYFFIPSNNLIIAIALVCLAGIVYAAPILLLRAMVGDAADEDTLVNGQDRTGLLFAAMTLTSKLGYAFASGITYMLLGKFGYVANLGAQNTASSILGLNFIFFSFPIISFVIVGFLMFHYPLSHSRVEEVQAQLAKRKS
jgi:glycoside/pentoside/hexuronide:cation symporter, GPH family